MELTVWGSHEHKGAMYLEDVVLDEASDEDNDGDHELELFVFR